MKRIILVLSLFVSNLFATSNSIENLKEQFNQNVVEATIYKKHYKEYLFDVCKEYDIECQLQTINRIKKYKSVQTNNLLQYDLLRQKNRVHLSDEYLQKLILRLKKEFQYKSLKDQEFVSSIDLRRQIYIILLYDKSIDSFHLIGTDLISSGNMEKEANIKWGDDHYFNTPTGVFKVTSGWRSEGKYKVDQNISYQPYGSKNRFIYHVGKLDTKRYHVFDSKKQKINDPKKWKLLKDKVDFAIHSHNSDRSQMGEALSHGCVRMTDQLNYFLDVNSILHKKFIKDSQWKKRFVKKPSQMKYKEFAGEYLVIFKHI